MLKHSSEVAVVPEGAFFYKDGVFSSVAGAATFILLTFWMLLSSCVGKWCFLEGMSQHSLHIQCLSLVLFFSNTYINMEDVKP